MVKYFHIIVIAYVLDKKFTLCYLIKNVSYQSEKNKENMSPEASSQLTFVPLHGVPYIV